MRGAAQVAVGTFLLLAGGAAPLIYKSKLRPNIVRPELTPPCNNSWTAYETGRGNEYFASEKPEAVERQQQEKQNEMYKKGIDPSKLK